MIRDVHPGSGSLIWIPDSDLDFLPIPDPGPGVKKVSEYPHFWYM
jgi:hypothetical protein